VYDRCALSQVVKDEMYKCYPDARRAHLKSGGNFPYLSRADEVNVYLQVIHTFHDNNCSSSTRLRPLWDANLYVSSFIVHLCTKIQMYMYIHIAVHISTCASLHIYYHHVSCTSHTFIYHRDPRFHIIE
jgi:hypothetical protein